MIRCKEVTCDFNDALSDNDGQRMFHEVVLNDSPIDLLVYLFQFY